MGFLYRYNSFNEVKIMFMYLSSTSGYCNKDGLYSNTTLPKLSRHSNSNTKVLLITLQILPWNHVVGLLVLLDFKSTTLTSTGLLNLITLNHGTVESNGFSTIFLFQVILFLSRGILARPLVITQPRYGGLQVLGWISLSGPRRYREVCIRN